MHGDDELAALLGPQPASLPLPLPQISVCETDPLDVLPRLRPHAMERAEEPFNLEPSMIIDVRQSARVFEVYHKLDERWRANTTQQALGTHVKAQEHSTPSATFASEERFLYFARRLNLNFQGIAELANLTDRQTRDALRIGTHYKPVFFTELTRVCLALVEMLAEELEDGEAGARKNPQRNAAYFKDCVEVFLSDLKVCVVSLNDVVERAYLMKLAHMAQLRALDTRYRDAFASAGAIARSAHRQSLRSWAKSVKRLWSWRWPRNSGCSPCGEGESSTTATSRIRASHSRTRSSVSGPARNTSAVAATISRARVAGSSALNAASVARFVHCPTRPSSVKASTPVGWPAASATYSSSRDRPSALSEQPASQ